jgi:hypothetical protein
VRNAITIALVLGFLATAASSVEAGRTRLDVRVYDSGMMPAADQTVALRAAAGVLAAAGIDVTWMRCAEDASVASACATPLGPTDLSVRFVRLPAAPSARGQLQLGYSLVNMDAHDGKLATVYVDRVQWLATQAGADSEVLLGFATAHEIGHLLLGTNAHGRSGLMRAVWSRTELQHADANDWLFSRGEASKMQASLAQRNGLRSSQFDLHATGCPASDGDDADPSTECGRTALASLRGVAPAADR